jgi:general secretion pathway protein A
MATYLRFYQFDTSPFESSNQKRAMVLGTHSLRGAFKQVKNGLIEDAPRICLSGSEGIGKTSFCRALPRLLGDSAKVALVLNPRRSWREIRDSIAKQFELVGGAISRRALLEAGAETKQLVLVIDQAEHLSHESLDHLDILLQYKRDDGRQLLHCVMLANLDSAASGSEIPLFWWLDKLTTLQLQFSPIPLEGLRHYVEKHLAKAGWAGGELFTKDALEAIHRNTGGLPRAINELCEKILMKAGEQGLASISAEFIEVLCGDTSEIGIERPGLASPEVSADFLISDFGISPSAQQLLDASDPESDSYEEKRPAPDSAYFENHPSELQSLILNQDSDEALEVESIPNPNKPDESQLSPKIELEDEPTVSPDDHEREFHTRRPVGMVARNRPVAETRRKKGYTGQLFLAGCVIAAAFWISAHFSSPAELINQAEVEITKVLDRGPAAATTDGTKPVSVFEGSTTSAIEEVEIEPTKHRSLIDRADEIAAATGLKDVLISEFSEPVGKDADTNTSTAQEIDDATADVANPEQLQAKLAAIPALRPAPKVIGNARPQEPQTKVSKTTPAASRTETMTPITAVKNSKSTAKVSDALVVLNEYVAIPEAAGSTPKLAVSRAAKTETDPARKKSVVKFPSAEPKKIATPTPIEQRTQAVPAKLDSAPVVELATKTQPAVQPAKAPIVEPDKKTALEAQASTKPRVESVAAAEQALAIVAKPTEAQSKQNDAAQSGVKPELPKK